MCCGPLSLPCPVRRLPLAPLRCPSRLFRCRSGAPFACPLSLAAVAPSLTVFVAPTPLLPSLPQPLTLVPYLYPVAPPLVPFTGPGYPPMSHALLTAFRFGALHFPFVIHMARVWVAYTYSHVDAR